MRTHDTILATMLATAGTACLVTGTQLLWSGTSGWDWTWAMVTIALGSLNFVRLAARIGEFFRGPE